MIEGGTIRLFETPGVEAPAQWVDAILAVAHDLRYRQFGRTVDVDRLKWELAISNDYAVALGWREPYGFSVAIGMYMDATFGEAAVWVADTIQTELAGYEFVQWPSTGWQLLKPGLRSGRPVWVDPATTQIVAPIGELLAEPSGS